MDHREKNWLEWLAIAEFVVSNMVYSTTKVSVTNNYILYFTDVYFIPNMPWTCIRFVSSDNLYLLHLVFFPYNVSQYLM